MDNSQNSTNDVDEPDNKKAEEVMNTEHSEIEDTDVRDDDARTYEEAWKVNKRSLMKGMGAAGATAAVGGVSMTHPAVSPVQEAEAIAPAVAAVGIGVALVGSGAAAGYWAGKNNSEAGEYQEEKTDSASTDIFRDGSYQDGLLEENDIITGIQEARDDLEQTVPLALGECKNIAIEKRANGATQSEANTAVLDTMRDYFSGVFKSFYRAQEQQVLLVEGWVDRTKDIYTGDNDGDPLPFCYTQSDSSKWDSYGPDSKSGGYMTEISQTTFEDREIELPNGKKITVRNGNLIVDNAEGYTKKAGLSFYGDDVDGNTTSSDGTDTNTVFGVHPSYDLETYDAGDTGEQSSPAYIHFPEKTIDSDSDGSNDWEQYHDIPAAETVNSEIQNAFEIAKNEITTTVKDIYNNYTQSEAQEVKDNFKSPVGRVVRQSEKYLETGDPAFAEGVAYEMGRPTSDPRISLILEYQAYDDSGNLTEAEEMVGQLVGWSPEEGEIAVGETYDTNNISEEVRFLQTTDSGKVEERVLDGEFTVITPESSDDYSESETRYGKNDTIGVNDPRLASRDISGLKSQFSDAKRARDDYDTAADSGGAGLSITGNAAVDLGIVGTVGAVLYYLFRGKSGSA